MDFNNIKNNSPAKILKQYLNQAQGKQILIFDCRPLQNSKFNGVTISAKNWFKEIIKLEFDEIILWSNARNKPYISDIFTTSSKRIKHVHTSYSNLLLSILWKFTNYLKLERILKLPKQSNQQITYFCPDLRTINLLETTKGFTYIHDIAFLKFPHFYSFKSKVFYKLINFKNFSKSNFTILTNSNFSTKEIEKHLKISQHQIKIAYPQLNWRFYKKQLHRNKKHTEKKQFICLGAFQKRKNTTKVIKAFLKFQQKHPEYKLILVGDYDPTFSKYNLTDLINSNIKIYNEISETKKIQLILESKAIIYTPVYEGFGIPILEAKLLNKQVITSQLKVFQEIFTNYPTYITSTEDLTKALIMFAQKED